MMTLFRYFKSELLCKSQANKYLTIHDIESANRKVKLEIDNSKTPPGMKRKVSYVTYTAEEKNGNSSTNNHNQMVIIRIKYFVTTLQNSPTELSIPYSDILLYSW